MEKLMNKYIIYTPSFDENNGGAIVLHKLCDLIKKTGNDAYLWPEKKPLMKIKNLYQIYRYYKKILKKGSFKTFHLFDTPIAEEKDIKDGIVIYPEIVSGNPLESENVVRWFLNKPGHLSRKINYGKNELYFFYLPAFNDKNINFNEDNLLKITFFRTDIYYQRNFRNREGSCYILRKGRERKIEHDLRDSILIDNLTHEEAADVFNKVKYCYSYDLYTLYTAYAVFCGCTVICIPEDGLSEKEWQSKEEYRYGRAYGVENIKKAEETKDLLFPYFRQEENNDNKSVERFIEKCEKFFNVQNK